MKLLLSGSILATLTAGFTWAQTATTNIADGLTPPAVKPGAPPGVQDISQLERINLYNGQVSVAIPLLRIAGRGEASFTMYAPIASRPWTVEITTLRQCPTSPCPEPPLYQSSATATNIDLYPYDSPYSPGVVYLKASGKTPMDCSGVTVYTSILPHIVYERADGTQVALWDGQAARAGGCGPTTVSGPTFRSVDESGLTFKASTAIPDTTGVDVTKSVVSGKLLFPDGTQYRVVDGVIDRITDRNGNYLSFQYRANSLLLEKITDTVGREVTIEYDVDDGPPVGIVDRITFKGQGGSTRTIRISRLRQQALASVIREGLETTIPAGNMSFVGTFDRYITEIRLPDSRSYLFRYTAYGELARMVLPTQAKIEWDHGPGLANAGQVPGTYTTGQVLDDPEAAGFQATTWINWRPAVYRRLIARRTYPGGAAVESTTTYSRRENAVQTDMNEPYGAIGVQIETQPYVEVSTTGTGLASAITTRHYFHENNTYPDTQSPLQSMLDAEFLLGGRFLIDQEGREGREYRSVTLKTPTGNLDRTELAYQVSSGRTVELCQRTRFVGDSTTRRVESLMLYDGFGNPTYQYDYGYNDGPAMLTTNGVPQSCAISPTSNYERLRLTNYVTGTDYTEDAIHLRSLPQTEFVWGRGGASLAQTSYEYDRRPLLALQGSAHQHDSATYSVGRTQRGNVTAIARYTGTNTLTSASQFDLAGNLRRNLEANQLPSGYAATSDLTNDPRARIVSYADNCSAGPPVSSLAFPTNVSLTPAVDGAARFSTATQYDCWLGQPVQFTDINGVGTSFWYGTTGPETDRLTQTLQGSGPATNQVNFQYGMTLPSVFVRTLSSLSAPGDAGIRSEVQYDGFGRPVQQGQWNGAAYIWTATQYDAANRVWKRSNPSSTGSFVYTVTAYDSLGRPTGITAPDSSLTTMEYFENHRMTTDPSQVRSIMTTDALGRVETVTENPRAPGIGEPLQNLLADLGSSATITQYGYDGADRLRVVCPPGGAMSRPANVCTGTDRARSFNYDWLGRLVLANNPESSQVNYLYDETASANGLGNLTSRTQNRGVGATVSVTTRYNYDALNRLTQTVYTGAPNGISTPAVTYTYDVHNPAISGATSYPKGRLTRVEASGGSVTAFDTIDALGRVTRSRQITAGATYRFGDDTTVGYTYLPGGAPASIRYPSQRLVTITPDSLGRPKVVSGVLSGATREYVTSATYTDHGALSVMRINGNRIRQAYTFDPLRLQLNLVNVDVCTDNTVPCTSPSALLALNNTYTRAGETGNGGGVANNGNPRSQTIQAGAGGFTALQLYEYDGWNRLRQFREQQPVSSEVLNETYCYDAHGNRAVLARPDLSALIPSVATCGQVAAVFPSNRMNGAPYDASGALGSDGRSTLRVDAEDRLRQSTPAGGSPTTEYEYDGQGRRVVKRTGTAVTTFVYDALGNLAAEYGGTSGTTGVQYLHGDGLGSTRLVTGGNGEVVQRMDYWPFGLELNSLVTETTYRTGALGYAVNSGPAQKFTGKERDGETGLDYFGARYFSGAQGRFTSPDAPFADQHPENPQSWNLYQYGYNNPLSNIDIDGRSVWSKAVKVVVKVAKTGNAAAGFADNIQDAATLFNPAASPLQRIGAGLSLASELLPVSVGDVKDAGRLLGVIDDAVDAGKQVVRNADDVADTGKRIEGVYEFSEKGKTYVGQSGDVAGRVGQHLESGKLVPGTTVTVTPVPGGKTAREVAEQKRINQLGGTANRPGSQTTNQRNPIGPKRQKRVEDEYGPLNQN